MHERSKLDLLAKEIFLEETEKHIPDKEKMLESLAKLLVEVEATGRQKKERK